MKQQRHEWLPSLVAGAVAVVTFIVVPGASVPQSLVSITAGSDTRRIEVVGGFELQLGYATDVDPSVLDEVTRNLRRRVAARGVDGEVRQLPGQLLVEIPGVTEADRDRFANLVTGSGKLEFMMVEAGSRLARELYQVARDDPRAAELGVTGQFDQWRHEETRHQYQDYYLQAPDRASLETYLGELARRAPELAPDSEHALVIEESAGDPRRSAMARTYYVDNRVVLGSTDVIDAEVVLSPWNTPETIVQFSDPAGQRFGELTRDNLGHKMAILIDGQVMAAPVIQSEIWGGRASVSPGREAADAQTEAENLAGALRAGALPIRLEVQDLRYRPASLSRASLLAARALFALAVGLLALLALRIGLGLAARATEPTDPVPRAVDRGRRWARIADLPWRRLAITIAGLVGVVLAGRLRLPAAELHAGFPGVERLSVFALGLAPILTAFILVELVALAVPGWRRLRHSGASGRARLGVATAVVTLALAGFQGWMVATWQQSLGLARIGSGAAALTCLTLAGGVFVLVALAWLIDRYGLGNGYSVLLLAGLVGAGRDLTARIRTYQATPAQILVGGVALAALVLATVWVLRSRRSGAGRDGLGRAGPSAALRWPTSGIVPLVAGSMAFALVEMMGMMGTQLPSIYWKLQPYLVPTRPGTFLVQLIAVVLTTCGFSWLFSRPANWWSARLRLIGADAGRTETAAATPSTAARSSLGRATLIAVGYLAVVSTIHFVTYWKISLLFFPLPVVLISTAILVDLVAEWRAFATHRDLVAVWPLHRVQIADDVVDALAAAGIPGHLRGIHHRSMLHFFAPYVPISVMVPRPKAAAAQALLAARLGPEAGIAGEMGDQERR